MDLKIGNCITLFDHIQMNVLTHSICENFRMYLMILHTKKKRIYISNRTLNQLQTHTHSKSKTVQ